MRQINRIIVHCSDTPPHMDIGAAEIWRWHTQDKGWSDIGYHYVIRRNGVVEAGRPLHKIGAHAKGHNSDSIGVCLIGGRNWFNYTYKQLGMLMDLVIGLASGVVGQNSGIEVSDSVEIIGHNEVSSKPCPRFDVGEFFK